MISARSLSVCFLSFIVFSGCSTSAPSPPAKPVVAPKPASPPKRGLESPRLEISGTEVHLRRTPCYGRCPSYSLTIFSGGGVEFEGERYVAAVGMQHGQADPKKLAALRQRLRDPAVAALADAYTPYGIGQKHCGQWATDAPTVTIEIGNGESRRRLEHYLGCEGAPALLQELESAIDDAAGVEAWISGLTLY